MIEILDLISNEMESLNIPYEFVEWTDELSFPYWIGEYLESESVNEDGYCPATFILTGTTNGSWFDLEKQKEAIEKSFPSIGGYQIITDQGNAIAVFYNSSSVIPTDTADLKRIQINLDVKKWKVN